MMGFTQQVTARCGEMMHGFEDGDWEWQPPMGACMSRDGGMMNDASMGSDGMMVDGMMQDGMMHSAP